MTQPEWVFFYYSVQLWAFRHDLEINALNGNNQLNCFKELLHSVINNNAIPAMQNRRNKCLSSDYTVYTKQIYKTFFLDNNVYKVYNQSDVIMIYLKENRFIYKHNVYRKRVCITYIHIHTEKLASICLLRFRFKLFFYRLKTAIFEDCPNICYSIRDNTNVATE